MSNDNLIQQFKLGKLEIDNTKLSHIDKIKLLQMENLLKDLIRYCEKQKKLLVEFNQGRFGNDM